VRSVFAKILLWFLFTVFVTFSVTFYVSSIFVRARQPEFPRLNFELRSARQAWETEGKAGLQRFLDQYKDAAGVEGTLTDGEGRDLMTGHDWSKELRDQRNPRQRGFFTPFVRIQNRRGFILSSPSRDQKYMFLVEIPNREEGWTVQVPDQTYWMLGIFTLLCWVLALRLTSPLRKMQKTIERFGHGDFTARVNSRRRDELGNLGRAVDQMAERIEGLLDSQRRLLQDISHELRSPLARLSVAVELARGGGDPEIAFQRIEREADRLNILVGELIQVTRAEGDPEGLATEPVRVDELIRVIVDDVHIEAERRQVRLELHADEAEMEGNPELLRRAIENIVRNAIRYSPPEGRVEISLDASLPHTGDGRIRIAVRDFGTGVPEDSLAHIFDPFYRVEKDRGRTSGGVGLGLAIARRAVELHHGHLRAVNMHPGLEVTIEFPVAAASGQEQKPALIS